MKIIIFPIFIMTIIIKKNYLIDYKFILNGLNLIIIGCCTEYHLTVIDFIVPIIHFIMSTKYRSLFFLLF